jgi:hypothetical protein
VGSVHATITQQASSCPFTVTPAAIAAGSGAADLTSALATEDFCSWSATSQASWITVDPASGNGNAQLTLHVNANPAAARHGVIVVGSASIAVDQAAATACTFTVAPSSYSASAAGGGVQVSVGTTGGCNWSVTGNPNWITVSPASGSGTGILTLSIQANSGSARTATLTIGNQSFVVTQAAASATCTYGISPTSFNNVPASGGNTSVTITAQAGCSWSVVGSPSWLTASKTTGTGGGTTTITVQSNSGAARNATLQIGGQNFPVSQAAGAASCTYQPTPTSFNVSSNSQSQLTTFVLTQGGCPSAATANVSWIQITAVPGFGNGNVVFDVSRNSGSSARTGTFTITGQSFSGTVTVTQDGR